MQGIERAIYPLVSTGTSARSIHERYVRKVFIVAQEAKTTTMLMADPKRVARWGPSRSATTPNSIVPKALAVIAAMDTALDARPRKESGVTT